MSQPSYTIIRVCQIDLQRMFWDEHLLERHSRQEFTIKLRRDVEKRQMIRGVWCGRTQEVSWLDENGNEIARVHQYITEDLRIGASGWPDPKRILIGNTLYRIVDKPDCNARATKLGPLWASNRGLNE